MHVLLCIHIVPHNDHGKLMQLLRPTASRWNQLANALNVPQSEIQVIAHENDYQRQLSEILNIWLRGNGKDRTPEVLISALETIGEGSLAEVLSKNHEFYALVGRKPPGMYISKFILYFKINTYIKIIIITIL